MSASAHDPVAGNGTPAIVVIIADELDADDTVRVQALLDEILAAPPEQLMVDLADCPSLDAAAIDVLLDAHRRARRAGCRLTLCSPSPRLRRNLKLARVEQVFQITSTPWPHSAGTRRPAPAKPTGPIRP